MQLHLFGLALLPIAALAHGTQMYHGHPLYHSPARLFFDVAEMRGNSTIVRRGEHIDDNKWDASVCRGRTLMALMEADDREAGQMMSPKKDSAGSIYVSCWEGKRISLGHLTEMKRKRADDVTKMRSRNGDGRVRTTIATISKTWASTTRSKAWG